MRSAVYSFRIVRGPVVIVVLVLMVVERLI
jgi:hypothetical protein